MFKRKSRALELIVWSDWATLSYRHGIAISWSIGFRTIFATLISKTAVLTLITTLLIITRIVGHKWIRHIDIGIYRLFTADKSQKQ
jgi:hypothetical protein